MIKPLNWNSDTFGIVKNFFRQHIYEINAIYTLPKSQIKKNILIKVPRIFVKNKKQGKSKLHQKIH